MSVRTNEYTVAIVGESGRAAGNATIEVTVRDESKGGLRHRPCTVSLRWRDAVFEATESDVYLAFQLVRLKLEEFGLRPVCYGACSDVQVSGMLVDMGDGTEAYRMSTQVGDNAPEVVSIFESDPEIEPAPVAEQLAYQQKMWSESE